MPKRKLAAIMFTDIVGYTSIMGSDEQKAVELLRQNRSIHQKYIKQHGGELLKEMGDGMLASFPTTSNAVYCAGAIQKASREIEGLSLRMGIHHGEVLVDKNDIYGDGVNVASRIEGLAQHNEILVSEPVYNNVKNRSGITGELHGEHELKNVDRPVKVYSVRVDQFPTGGLTQKPKYRRGIVIGGIAVFLLAILLIVNPFKGSGTHASDIGVVDIDKSIAVLPFKNLSNNEEDQFLADGVMDAILLDLSKIENLRVITRTSVEQYRNTALTIPEIAAELNVNHVLEGSFQKHGDQANLIVQLSNAQKIEDHLWADEFNRNWSNIFTVQSEVAQLIARKLKVIINPVQKKRMDLDPTTNLDAYTQYLRGRDKHNHYLESLDKAYLEEALLHYNEALEKDSVFALAKVSIARAIWDGGFDEQFYQEHIIDTVKQLCDEALVINPNLAEGYFIRARCHEAKSNFEDQGNDLRTALKLNPNHSEAYAMIGRLSYMVENDYVASLDYLHEALQRCQGAELGYIFGLYSWFYLDLGMFEKAKEFGRREVEIKNWSNALFWTYLHQGEFEKALTEADRYQDLFPNRIQGLWHLAAANLYLENHKEANTYFNILFNQFKSEAENHRISRYRNRYGYLLWIMGKQKEAEIQFSKSTEYLNTGELLNRGRARDNNAYNMAATASFLKDYERTYYWLDRLDEFGWHWGNPFHITRDPMFDNVRNQDRFQQIVTMAQDKKATIRAKIRELNMKVNQF